MVYLVHYTCIYLYTDIDNCNPNPCFNGECVDGVASYTCNCDDGWTGENCGQSKHTFPVIRKAIF